MRTRRGLLLLAIIVLVVVPGCGDDDGNEAAGLHRVVITADGYEPAELRIGVGDRVTFVNRSEGPQSAKDARAGAIEVSPQPGPTKHDGSEVNRATRKGFATHALFPAERQTVVFPVEKRYAYGSAFSDMTGVIDVTQSGD